MFKGYNLKLAPIDSFEPECEVHIFHEDKGFICQSCGKDFTNSKEFDRPYEMHRLTVKGEYVNENDFE